MSVRDYRDGVSAIPCDKTVTRIDTDELEILKKDAARYRYLRASRQLSGGSRCRLEWYLPQRFGGVDFGTQLDENIDAAIEGEK